MINVYLNSEHHCQISHVDDLVNILWDLELDYENQRIITDSSELDLFGETGNIYLISIEQNAKVQGS